MRNIRLLSLLLLAVLFTFSSCGDKDEDPKPKTNKELLSAKTWKVSRIKEDGMDVTNEPAAAYWKNTRLKFNADGTYSSTTTGYSDTGIWEFANNENRVITDPNTDEEESWDITELKDNSLKIRTTAFYEDEEGDVETALLEIDFVHAE